MFFEKILEIKNAIVKTNNTTLLKNISFELINSENWAVVGPSGSGKTSFLQLIAGNLSLTGGSINYNFPQNGLTKHTENAVFTHRKKIAMVASKHHFKNLSNTADFYYQQRFNSSDSENAPTVLVYLQQIVSTHDQHQYWTFAHTTCRLKLDDLLDKQLIKLSNGETKRLLLAASLLKNPSLLLLDNPMVGLDITARVDFDLLITEITDSGIAIIMTTTAKEIPESITNVAVMQHGEIINTCLKEDFEPEKIELTSELSDYNLLHNLLDKNSIKSFNVILKMDNVNVQYSGKQILKNINWEVLPGEHWALLGHNGAGKSTLLSLVNGDNPQAYANKIILFDRKRGSGESIWDIKKNIGFVSPELHQYFPSAISCLQVVESGFYDTLGLFRPAQQKKTDLALQWMQILGIANNGGKLLKNTTASVQRLYLLARAMVKNPALLILDEPCQGLDSWQKAHFKDLITQVCLHSNVALIYVTHYMDELPNVITKTIKLQNGERIDH